MNSPTAAVIEGFKVFGPKQPSPFGRYWKSVLERHYEARDLEYWIKTGKHLPRKRVKRQACRSTKREKVMVSNKKWKELMSL